MASPPSPAGQRSNIGRALEVLTRGRDLPESLSTSERYVIAVGAGAPPAHSLTLTSALACPAEANESFAKFRKRIEYEIGSPFIYFATLAKSAKGHAGWHFHIVHWNGFIHVNKIRAHALGSGFEKWVKVDYLPRKTALEQLDILAYLPRQHERVFDSHVHARHEPRRKGGRTIQKPHDKTLAKHQPKLLSAINRARDPSIPDHQLVAPLPIFIGGGGWVL